MLNLVYQDFIPEKWINGAPFTGWTSTGSPDEHLSVHKSAGDGSLLKNNIRVTLLLEPSFASGTAFQLKIPMLKNPSSDDMPFRMNVTLKTFPAGSSLY